MKKIYSFAVLLLISLNLFAQKNQQNGVIRATEFHVTQPIREIFAKYPVDESKLQKEENEESEDRKHRKPQRFKFSVKDGLEYGNDENTIQKEMGTVPSQGVRANWAGQTASGFRPFDPSGAVGPNHYVQMINSTTFKIYNKSTGAVMLTGTLGNLWSPATANAGDPIVMYDKAADRWFLAQFGSSAGKQIYIAVSQTNDPTGAYYTYTYVSPVFPDYLKFSVWTDGYYMTSNQSPQKVFAFNRAEILAGTPGARSVYTTFSPPSSGFFCPLPGDAADGTLPPVGTPCPIMSYSDNAWGSGIIDGVNIYNMSVNWTPTTPTATITSAASIPTAAFDASYNSSWNDCPQPGTTQMLDGIGGVCMYRAQWKTWPTYNSVVLNWAVKLSTTQRGIKWCELRQDISSGVWSLYQEGIYNPDASTRWMGAIAMDNNGSIGLSYIKSDATSIYPGLYYTGRRPCDPLGTLPVTETLVAAGTGSQTGVNRVGDYSHTTLDMDGITFWSTSEYMGGATGGSAAATRIFSYQITPCGNNALVTIAQTSGTNPQCPGSSATFTATPFNGGSAPTYQWKLNGANVGTNSATYTNAALVSGDIISCVMTSNLAGVTGSPATSNSITMVVNAVTTPTISIAQTGGTNPTCPGIDLTFTATTTNVGGAPSYQWKINGTNAGTNSSTFTTSTITTGQVVTCVVTSSALCNTTPTATSNGITITVNSTVTPTVTIAQTTGTNPTCSGLSTTFTATAVNAVSPSYQWKVDGSNVGTNSATYTTSTLTNGQVVTCVITSAGACPTIATLGTATTTNTTTSDLGVAYPTYYGNGRQQYLVKATELTALGLTAGNISSLAFNVAATVGNPATMNGYTIKMANTTSTVMTAAFLAPTFTTVYGPTNYTPNLNAWNTHTFSTPFNWDGTSNVLIDICFSNSVVGNVAYQTYQSASAFVSTAYYQADGTVGAGACATTTVTSSGSIRPNMKFTKSAASVTATSNAITMTVNTSVAPSVAIALTTGTNPSCSGSSLTFTATPTNGGTTPSYQWKVNGSNVGTNSATYTSSTITTGQIVTCVLTSSSSCASPTTATSNAITMTVNTNVTPSVSITLTTGTNPTCAGSSLTFTATPTNGGSTPSYQWQVNGSNVGTNSATYTSSTITSGQIVTCILTSSSSCASPTTATSNAITMTVNTNVTPSVSIALTTGTNPTCSGSSLTFTATPSNGGSTPSYQWKVNGSNVGTNTATYTSSTITTGQIVTCILTSNASCASPTTATSNAITMTVNTTVTPTISIALTGGTNPSCAGTLKTFTASITNGGASPIYQWKINGSNVGTNSATYSSSTLTSTQSVTCVLTSNATCASTTTSTSNAIVMTINSASSNTPQNVTACNSYTWPVNGLTYTSSGVKTANFTNAAGCDSTRTLNLTINLSSSSSSSAAATGSYTWAANGTTYTVSGVYTHTLINAVGCDSVLTLNLTINIAAGVKISPKVLLAGPYVSGTGLMFDSLRVNGMIPTTEPYSLPPLNYPQVSYVGGETVSPSILSITGNNAIVDWVYLELRSSSNPSSVVASKRALLQRDGDVVSSTDGISPITFTNQTAENYYVSIKHRNHLGVMTATAIPLSSIATTIDFSSTAPVWVHPSIINNPPRKASGSVMLLYCGDANNNKNVKYNGATNDKDAVLNAVGVATPNNILTGYRIEDVNLDSKVKYNNTDNDRGVILNSVGGNTPNLILFQHTPN